MLRPMPNPSPQEEAEFEGSFSYHVGVLVGMSRLYFRRGAAIAAVIEDADPQHAASDALFEMLLVRLRAFDSFFDCVGNHPTDAHASDWAPRWAPHGVLLGTEREDISKRLAHLTYRQPPVHEWPIGEMVRRCCEVVDDFLGQLGATAPQNWQYRHTEVQDFLQEHGQEQWDQIWTENDNHAHRRR
jgi:hypothetical protein